MALLLLRAVFGASILVQGGLCLGQPDPAPATWVVGLTGLATGILLLIGFLTPIAGLVVGAAGIAIGLSVLPACSPSLFDSKLAIAFAAAMLVGISVLGPGAFSVDARVFGRREIIIPPAAPHTRP